MKFDFYKRLIYLLDLVKKRKKHIISYLIACLFIYIGLWTTAWQDIPEQVDESAWLRRSIRAEATFYKIYPEVFEFNYSSLNQLTTSGYIIGLGRWLQGIPAEAVKRYKHNENIAPDIRASMLAFYAGLSSLSLLILFFWLHRIYGSVAAISTIALMMLSPFWQLVLRRIMAEPCLFFFSILAFGTTMLLVEVLFNQKPLWVILVVATLIGFWIGLAAGVKLNGLFLFVGIIAVLLTLPWRGYEHYFLLLWIGATVFLSAVFSFVLTNPIFWHFDIINRFQQVVTFRSVITVSHMIRHSSHHLIDMSSSIRASFLNAFNMSSIGYGNVNYANYFSIIPTFASLILFLVGVWYCIKKYKSFYNSHIWFLSIMLVNVLMVPLNWDRYFMFTTLSAHVFTGIGISYLIQIINKQSLVETCSKKIRSYNFYAYEIIGGSIYIVAALTIVGLLTYSTIQQRPIHDKWKDIAYSKDDTTQTLELSNEIVELNPSANYFGNGKPLIEQIESNFFEYSRSHDPDVLSAIYHTGELLLTHSQNEELKARVAHEMQFMGQRYHDLTDKPRSQICYTYNKQPILEISSTDTPVHLVENGHILLEPKTITVQLTITTQQYNTYRFRIKNNIVLPGHVMLGVYLDNQQIVTINYQANQTNWYEPNLDLVLNKGKHELIVKLLNIPSVTLPSSLWSIHLYPTQSLPCTIGQLPIVLPRRHTISETVSFVAPVPALYDVELTYPQPITKMITGLVDNVYPISSNPKQSEANPIVTLPPIYLTTGNHFLTVSPYTITWQQLKLTPHLPSKNEIIPPKFEASHSQVTVLTATTNLTYSWKWFQNGVPYSFYRLKIYGSNRSISPTKIAVAIDNNLIGTTELNRNGTPQKPLIEELANGGTHTISISSINLNDAEEAYLYAVQIERIDSTLIFAGSSMRWDKQYNHQIETDNSVIHLPPDITLSKNMMIDSEGVYSVTVRYRVKTSMDPNSQLHFNIGGWPIGQIATPETPDWQDYTFTTYLTTGDHDFQLWWENMSGHELIDVMYVIAEKNAL